MSSTLVSGKPRRPNTTSADSMIRSRVWWSWVSIASPYRRVASASGGTGEQSRTVRPSPASVHRRPGVAAHTAADRPTGDAGATADPAGSDAPPADRGGPNRVRGPGLRRRPRRRRGRDRRNVARDLLPLL